MMLPFMCGAPPKVIDLWIHYSIGCEKAPEINGQSDGKNKTDCRELYKIASMREKNVPHGRREYGVRFSGKPGKTVCGRSGQGGRGLRRAGLGGMKRGRGCGSGDADGAKLYGNSPSGIASLPDCFLF